MISFYNLNKTDVVIVASETEDLEATARTIMEATSWMDWWTYSAKSLALSDSSEVKKVKHHFVASTHCQLLGQSSG